MREPSTDRAPQAPSAGARALRVHLALLLGGVLAVAAALGVYGWRLQPPEGDLVRISGLSERAYGWNGEAEGLPGSRYDRISEKALEDGAAEGAVLVFGDSFSLLRPHGVTWINRLQIRAGHPVRFVRITDLRPVKAYLASDAFRRGPPLAVVVQTVERAVADRALEIAGPDGACAAPAAPAHLATGPTPEVETVPFRRRTAFEDIDELFSRGALSARLRLAGGAGVLDVGLKRGGLFTSAASDRLLLLNDDVTEHAAAKLAPLTPGQAAEAIRCSLRDLAALAGDVPFRLAVAPDKRTIYAPWIADDLPPKALDLFAIAQEALGPVYVDLRAPLAAAAAEGVKDVYWPDDTHWGAVGHRIAGDATADSLLAPAPD